ncbi:3-oxoacyl-ACP synthase III family protein [Maledivibacter halophilus]|uniref:3-oxoacyl-[acyl-carrier-protein] synthase-3 n=1 Tax=Maledivibacter halophilus TaxID=36842 RepID=A0A1T5LKK7_9FIRM|nr:3-oxoacyl-ACP synthase III family protein [Maledivibacter halophilus]SKC76414.1 3-oxoacyl-[acyl-carrier-protein] synthase-3 [Maledivibacter halophilus]
MNYSSVGIQGVGYSVPERRVTNEDIEKMTGLDKEKVKFFTGLEERRWANDKEAFSTFGVSAAKEALEDAKVDPKDVNLLIVATGSGDFFSPAIGCLIQHEVGLENAFVLNLNQACAAPNYALATAIRFIIDGTYNKALVICGDVTTRMLNPNENLFVGAIGDGASAVVLGKLKDGKKGFISEHFDSDGKYYYGSGLFNNGSRVPREELGEGKNYFITRDEIAGIILPNVIKWFKTCLNECLAKANLKQEDIDFISPHPAALSQIIAQLQSIKEDLSKTHIVTDLYGHSGGGTSFIVLKEALKLGKLEPGDIVYNFGNGAGFQWGGMIFRWCDKNDFLY